MAPQTIVGYQKSLFKPLLNYLTLINDLKDGTMTFAS